MTTAPIMNDYTTTPRVGETASAWWDGEAEHVRAVLEFAWMHGDAGDQAFDRIIRLFAPHTAPHIAQVARMLYRIDRLESGLIDAEVGGESAASNEAEELRLDAVLNADLIGSLIQRGVR